MYALQTLEVTTHTLCSPALPCLKRQRPCVSNNLASQPFWSPPSLSFPRPRTFLLSPPYPTPGRQQQEADDRRCKPRLLLQRQPLVPIGGPDHGVPPLLPDCRICMDSGHRGGVAVIQGGAQSFAVGLAMVRSVQVMHVMCTVPASAAYDALRTPPALLTLIMG